LVQTVKNLYIPSGEHLAEETWTNVSFSKDNLTSKIIIKNFNNYLTELVDKEYQIYLAYESECISKGVIELSLKPDIKEQYPYVYGLIEKTISIFDNKLLSNIKKLSQIGSQLRPFYKLVEQSFSQGRMSRAGGSSQYHLKKLLELAGYKGEFQEQQILNGTVDFLFPSKEIWDKDKRKCVIVSMKRTLRERYKQIFEELKITGGITIYLLVTETIEESKRDITSQKVDKLNSQNVYLVVRDEIKTSRFPQKSNVISFTSFIQEELPNKRTQWSSLYRKK
ncbi:MAG: hypothetical protein EPO24_01110, partial [Bacteroidetes bacterium]